MKPTRTGLFLTVAVLAGLLATSLAIAQKDDQAEVLMQAAHQKQLVEGQMEEAIQLYKRIVQEHAGNRAVAAQALLEMGQCYEKLGNAEARKAYERVLREYADQPEVAEARRRLAALGQPAGSGNGSEMVTRRVWAGSDVEAGVSLSPDGRYLSCIDGTTGDLALRDLATGKMRRLTKGGSSTDFMPSAISPDGRLVARRKVHPRFVLHDPQHVPDCPDFGGGRLAARFEDARLVPDKRQILPGRALYRV